MILIWSNKWIHQRECPRSQWRIDDPWSRTTSFLPSRFLQKLQSSASLVMAAPFFSTPFQPYVYQVLALFTIMFNFFLKKYFVNFCLFAEKLSSIYLMFVTKTGIDWIKAALLDILSELPSQITLAFDPFCFTREIEDRGC